MNCSAGTAYGSDDGYDAMETHSASPPPPGSPPFINKLFARLIPINTQAQAAIRRTLAVSSVYHCSFIKAAMFEDRPTLCFELSLDHLPEFPDQGWRIGSGFSSTSTMSNRGVDLMLAECGPSVESAHSRLCWIGNAAGFFLVSTATSSATVTLNGSSLPHRRHVVPWQNAIFLGDCAFTLEYADRTDEQDQAFQMLLRSVLSRVLNDENPFILPTPREHDSRFGDWVVQHPISKGGFGTVYMVVHSIDGRVAAAKQLVENKYNEKEVTREVVMSTRIAQMWHDNVAIPLEVRSNRCRGAGEIARIKTELDLAWVPDVQGDIVQEHIIFSPLMNATFRTIANSSLPEEPCASFFAEMMHGVRFLHHHGIAHRDLKPENVLIRSLARPSALLCDFGSAATDGALRFDDAVGTERYWAPELREGGVHGAAVDEWACALVGIELITKQPVCERLVPGRHLQRWHRDLEAWDTPMAACCRAMLAVDPGVRMRAEEAVQMLERRLV